MTRSKTIIYRGGVAEFAVPGHWREEYEPAGGGTFYEDSPESGTLRLNVLSFSSKDTPADQMAAGLFPDRSASWTAAGFPVQREDSATEENGERLHIVYWKVAIPVPPRSVRLAVFSYTILESQLKSPAFSAEIQLLERSVMDGRYSQEEGMTGDYDHA